MSQAEWQWFHCTAHTYGAWLPGDEHGFRTRHHREHVEGDYKNPPPQGMYEDKLERSKQSMTQDAVVIPKEFREVVGRAMIEKLDQLQAVLIAISVSGQQVHLLAKMPADAPREWVGKAKKNATHALTALGWQGKVWAIRSQATPVRDRGHQINAFNYILRHAKEGAWVWNIRDGKQTQSPAVATAGLSATAILTRLVAIPSINPMGRDNIEKSLLYEDRAVDYIEQILKQRNIPFTRTRLAPYRSNITATYSPSNPKRRLLFEAHLDTVPIDGMTVEPFGSVIKDGKLYGRGACDVKAGVAAMLAAFLRVVESGSPNALTVAFTVDEEHTFLGVQHLVKNGLEVDFAVVAEPTSLNIVTSHKGVARWTTSTAGKAVHSSKPHEGVSAVYRMAKVLAAIEAYSPKSPLATISVGMIAGGVSPNTVPDACSIEVDRRLVPGETAASALAEFETMIAEQRFNFDVTNSLTFACPPLEATPSDHVDMLALRQAIEAVHGAHSLEAVPFGTDAATLAEAGIPCVVFGPGSIEQAHTHDEWVELEQVEKAAEILYRFAINGE